MSATNIYSLPFADKVKENKDAFLNKVVDVSSKLDTLPQYLMVVMNNESGVNSKAKNPTSSATGLIQFTEDTAKSLGTTTDALSKMSNVQQLDYVYKYLSRYKNEIKDGGDAYLAVFFPLALFQKDNYVFPKWVIDANKAKDGFAIFDLNKDGTLTKAEFKQYVQRKYGQYFPVTQPASDVNKNSPQPGEQKKNNTGVTALISAGAIIVLYAIISKIRDYE